MPGIYGRVHRTVPCMIAGTPYNYTVNDTPCRNINKQHRSIRSGVPKNWYTSSTRCTTMQYKWRTKAQHHQTIHPVYGMVDTVHRCVLYCAEHIAHSTLSTIQHNTSPLYTVHGTSCAAHTVPAIFIDVKIMRIKAQEKISNSSGIKFFLHKQEETRNFQILNYINMPELNFRNPELFRICRRKKSCINYGT